jgi:asparagine synthase (glutamine-hydrolysing)
LKAISELRFGTPTRTTSTRARSRGVKPLYFHQAKWPLHFCFGNQSDPPTSCVTAEVSEEALYHYLTFLRRRAPQTLFHGIHKIPRANMLVIDRGGERV